MGYSFSFIVGNSSNFYSNTVIGEISNIQLLGEETEVPLH